jgi:hypothetical protein
LPGEEGQTNGKDELNFGDAEEVLETFFSSVNRYVEAEEESVY